MGKYVLITGASSGLGKAAAKKLAQDGFKVFAGVRKQEDKDALEKLNSNIKGIFLDVTCEESVKAAFEEISQITGDLYALVNNAGIALAGPVEYIPVDILKKQFEVNVFGAIRVAQAALPFMRNLPDTRIVNLSSMASYGAFPFISPYCVSKRALDMFFNSLAVECKMSNLKVISIKPGVVMTPIWRKSLDECEKNRAYLCEEAQKKYEKEFDVLTDNAGKNTQKGLRPENVANLISKVLKVSKPRLSYNIGTDSILVALMSLLPQSLINFVVKSGLARKVRDKK